MVQTKPYLNKYEQAFESFVILKVVQTNRLKPRNLCRLESFVILKVVQTIMRVSTWTKRFESFVILKVVQINIKRSFAQTICRLGKAAFTKFVAK